MAASLVGPFAFQANNDTRQFEYPWAYETLGAKAGMKILEVGGSLSGFQFVLSREGCEVVNVDPADDRHDYWPLESETLSRLNRRFGTRVTLKQCLIQHADLPAEAFDRVVSISVIEHIGRDNLLTLLEHIRRVLRPGGRFALTLDLFLDLFPFTATSHNKFGTNISVSWLVRQSGLSLVYGERQELYGFKEFDAKRILAQRAMYYVGHRWPTMVQALVLAKQ
jgi:SAM-dependent methyltransferase